MQDGHRWQRPNNIVQVSAAAGVGLQAAGQPRRPGPAQVQAQGGVAGGKEIPRGLNELTAVLAPGQAVDQDY